MLAGEVMVFGETWSISEMECLQKKSHSSYLYYIFINSWNSILWGFWLMAVLQFSSKPIELTVLELSKTYTSQIWTLLLDSDLMVVHCSKALLCRLCLLYTWCWNLKETLPGVFLKSKSDMCLLQIHPCQKKWRTMKNVVLSPSLLH